MAAKPKLTNQEQIKQFYDHTDHPLKEVMLRLHGIIMATDPEIGEHIKWNSPAFYYTGEMAPFDPKEYKRDIVVYNVHKKDEILLIFPTGAKVDDKTGILGGKFTDTRKSVQITSMEDLLVKENDLKSVIRQWLTLVEK
ncbi:MAG: DUF1801 domain-containing protein [Saprospiraceae bacterium]|jgi:hypothetical protein|nr:DUF1801 domain-containing protein [Saprospiraceae bacterium]MBP6236131.1 DUF1801 domain-containing protein [Saprospiraceae bacterium]MBP6567771.1 DUF1801 domain-containing protein [Saprospiraceae bacterium]